MIFSRIFLRVRSEFGICPSCDTSTIHVTEKYFCKPISVRSRCRARANIGHEDVARDGEAGANEIKFGGEERDNGRAIDSRKTRISWRLPFLRGRASTGVAPATWQHPSGELLYRLPARDPGSRAE